MAPNAHFAWLCAAAWALLCSHLTYEAGHSPIVPLAGALLCAAFAAMSLTIERRP